MPTLYDSYQLSNSRMIPEYVGSAIPEIRQQNAQLQEQFNVGKEYSDMIDQAVKTSTASSYDQPVLDQLKNEYRSKLKSYAEKGDYENMWRNVAMDARDFVGKYKPIAQNQAAISSYVKELDDRVAKGEVSKKDYEAKMRQIQDTYTGLQYDPATGQYKNQFSQNQLVKAPDMIAKINAILTNTHAIERGYKVTGMDANNDYVISNGSTTKKLPWASVKQYIDSGMAIDPDVQSYMSQQKELAPYMYGFSNKLTDTQIRDIVHNNPGVLSTGVYNNLKQGKSWKEAFADTLTEAHMNDVWKNIYGLGQKGIIDEQSSERSQTLSSVGADRIKRDEEAPIRFLVPGADTRFEEKDRDVSTLSTSIDGMQKNIEDLKNRLATAPENEKKILQAQIARSEDMIQSKRGILQGAQEKVAKDLGYKSYSDYLQQTGQNYTRVKWDSQGNRIPDFTATDAEPMRGVKNIPQKSDAQTRFEDALATEVKTNAQNYAFKPLNMSLNKDEAEGLKRIVISQPSAFQWFKPGSTSTTDAPKDFDINQIQVVEKGGVFYLQANGVSTKAKEKGSPTGDVYTIAITPGSNIGDKIAQNLVGKNRKLTPEMARAAATLSGYTFNGDILNLQNNESFTVRDSKGEIYAIVKREPYQAAGGSRYVIYNRDGQVLKDKDGPFESNNADEISSWLNESLMNSIKSDKKK